MVLLVIVPNLSADTNDSLSNEPLQRLDSFLKNTNPTPEEARELGVALQTLAYSISQKLIGASSEDWSNPSPQRLDAIKDAQRLLMPHNKNLIQATFELTSSSSRYVGRQARSLLDYTKADQVFETEVRQRIYNLDIKERFVAADLLYEHRKLTSSDRAALVAGSMVAKTERDKIMWARGLLRFGMAEGLPIISKLLEVPFDPKGIIGSTGVAGINESFSNYGPASEAAQYLGIDAAPLIPILEQRLSEIQNSNLGEAGVPLIRDIRMVIRYANGELQRKRRYAVNGTGPLDEQPHQAEVLETQSISTAASPKLADEPTPKSPLKPIPAFPAPQNNKSIWLFVGLITLVVVAIFIAYKKKP